MENNSGDNALVYQLQRLESWSADQAIKQLAKLDAAEIIKLYIDDSDAAKIVKQAIALVTAETSREHYKAMKSLTNSMWNLTTPQ